MTHDPEFMYKPKSTREQSHEEMLMILDRAIKESSKRKSLTERLQFWANIDPHNNPVVDYADLRIKSFNRGKTSEKQKADWNEAREVYIQTLEEMKQTANRLLGLLNMKGKQEIHCETLVQESYRFGVLHKKLLTIGFDPGYRKGMRSGRQVKKGSLRSTVFEICNQITRNGKNEYPVVIIENTCKELESRSIKYKKKNVERYVYEFLSQSFIERN